MLVRYWHRILRNALTEAKNNFRDQAPCVNVWIVPENKILKSTEEDNECGLTLSEKKYREPVAYKVLDKINAFKNKPYAINK